MATIITLERREDIKNQALLLFVLAMAIIPMINMDLDADSQIFVYVALATIIPIVAIMAITISILTKPKKSNNGSLDFKNELKRKAFHFVGLLVFIPPQILWIPYYAGVTGFNYMFNMNAKIIENGFISFIIFIVTYALLIIFMIIEFIRLKYVPNLFNVLLREKEYNRIASYFYSTVSIFFVSLAFLPHDNIVCAAIAMGFLADLAACLIGKRLHKIAYRDRSLEGFIANFITGGVVGYYFVGAPAIIVALIIATVDFINGALNLRINDNLIFPLLAAALLYPLVIL